MMQRSWFERRMTIAILLMAALAGTALAVGFVRFDALHRQFLGANFDSVHGARTLLKAAHFIALAEERLQHAAADPSERQHQLTAAVEALGVAEHYSAEGNDTDPLPRATLSLRLHDLRQQMTRPHCSRAPNSGR
jgi:two-component system, sensor histidine kinase and response regulator